MSGEATAAANHLGVDEGKVDGLRKELREELAGVRDVVEETHMQRSRARMSLSSMEPPPSYLPGKSS